MPQVTPSSQFAVEADDLTKKFGQFTAASHISFHIKPGEIYGLLGPNGAGKSTTFKMLCGLLKPTEGKSFLYGTNIQEASGRIRAELGYMAQKFSLYGTLTVIQNLRYFAGIYGLQSPEKEQKIDEMIAIFDLKPHLNQIADSLPLGFKQRLALACALMHAPPILFLDEPTSGVDPLVRREFWNHINGLVHKGVTVLVTTHFMEEAEYCDRIALIYRSKMIKKGDPDSIKKAAATPDNPDPTLEEAFIHLIQNYEGGDGIHST
jgi:ABC-2 type transport system ATP-binding protein